MEEVDNYTFCLLGCDGVGRSSIVRKLVNNTFEENSTQYVSYFKINGHDCDFVVIGKGEARPMERHPGYIRILDCIIFVYAVTSRNSLNELATFNSELDYIDSIAPRILIGNKSDLADEREVTYEEGQSMAKTLKCSEFYELSAKTSEQNKFEDIFKKLMEAAVKAQDGAVKSITKPALEPILEPVLSGNSATGTSGKCALL